MHYAKLPPPVIEYCGIRFTDEGMSSSLHGKPLEFIPKAEIAHINLRVGFRDENPMLRFLLGVALTGLGLLGMIRLLEGLFFGAEFAWYPLLVFLLPLGAWMIVTTFQRGLYLEVETQDEKHRLFFRGALERPETLHFLKQAVELGYPLTTLNLEQEWSEN
jgi:hypothetical protein